jgi:hypothetical protein
MHNNTDTDGHVFENLTWAKVETDKREKEKHKAHEVGVMWVFYFSKYRGESEMKSDYGFYMDV